MAHNLDMTNGRANIAFLGSRDDVWHRMGQEMQPGMDIDAWAKAASLEWEAVKVPAIAALDGARFDHIDSGKRFAPVPNCKFVARSDNGHVLGWVSDRYQPVQPRDVLDWFGRYIAVDDRFALDVAGSLKGGAIIWATATFRDPLSVAGDKHVARVLMTTTFDGSGSTINKGTMTRVVCNNTLDVALMERAATIRTTHATKFDAKRVGEELARVAQGFATYKAMGDALAQVEMSKDQVSAFFKHCLDIPLDAKSEDVSSRKMNQFDALRASLTTSKAEGAEGAWAALNAITRYVDHERGGDDEKRFTSAQFGSGAGVKAKAVDFLMPLIKDRVPVAA
jgi:phage/plasmid-like protein (TIGR03299 family)